MADQHHSTDRDDFGHWISGFVAGEGCFTLYWRKSRTKLPRAAFSIELRADDEPILTSIRDYFGADRVYTRKRKGNKLHSVFITNNTSSILNILIPHFEKYPLRAKKARDFLIWRQAVILLAELRRRPIVHYTFGHGTRPKYTPDELRRFQELYRQLRDVKLYNSAVEELPPDNGHKATGDQQFLPFDQCNRPA